MVELRTVNGDVIAQLDGQTLEGADLSGAVLREVELSGGRLARADLRGATLCSARLVNAQLVKANLAHADLSHAQLREADLRQADLTSATLLDADLSGANLAGARLTGADLHGAKLAGAQYDHHTQWPAGLVPAQRGAVLQEEPRSDIETQLSEARDLLAHGRPNEAVPLLLQAVHQDPQSFRGHHLLGCAYGLLHDVDRALQHFKAALAIRPDSASTHYDIAVLYRKSNDADLAIEHLQEAVKLAPEADKAQRLLLELAAKRRGQLVQALQRSPDPAVRRQVVKCLAALHDNSAVPDLLDSLAHETDETVRAVIADSVVVLGVNRQHVPALIFAWPVTHSHGVRRTLVQAALRLPVADTGEFFQLVVSEADDETRQLAVAGLAASGDVAAVPVLKRCINDRHVTVRLNALAGLVRILRPEKATLAAALVADGDDDALRKLLGEMAASP